MLPGPTIIRACPYCSRSVLQHTLSSANTFGARFWTDGWCEAPMNPDQPWLVKCPHCSDLFWIDEAQQLAEEEYGEPVGPQHKNAKDVKTPCGADYHRFLATPQADKNKETYVRVRAWWAANSARRKNPKSTGVLKERDRRSLDVLFGLIDGTELGNVIMKADIARTLGRFDECIHLLSGAFDDDLLPAVEFIRKLAREQDSRVAEVVGNGA